MFKYELSDKVKNFIKRSNIDEVSIGCSDSQVFKITKEDNVYYLKVAKLGLLTKEYEKLSWLDGKLSVPRVILYDTYNKIEYLITAALKGEMICNKYYENNYDMGIKVLKQAFDNIYNVDISTCPFNTDINYRLSIAEYNVNNNLIKNENLSEDVLNRFGSANGLLSYLKENKFEAKKCFSHGDPSLPNIFGTEDKFEGLIDVGECGVSDIWFDLAICEKSIKRNYGKEYINKFYEELNIIPDRGKIEYYQLLMELYL